MIYIVIVNFKCWNDTFECLSSLLEGSYQQWQAIVVDNASNDNSLLKIKNSLLKSGYISDSEISIVNEELALISENQKILLVQSSINRGFAGANNLILEKLFPKAGYVWLLNPDIIVQKNTLQNLFFCAQRRAERLIYGMIIKSFGNPDDVLFRGGAQIHPFLGTVKMLKEEKDTALLSYINGSSLFTSLEVFKEVGLLDEKYFLYWEEAEWCFRAKSCGIGYAVCNQAVGYDKGAKSIGRGFLSDYYYGRNALIFLNDHYKPIHVVSSIFFSFFRILNRFVSGNQDRAEGLFQGIIDFLKGRNGKRK